tara:strand:- start:25974 stop:26483 length:510 start_codon:yes stop_codon:yes gene_type:complete
MWVAIFSHSGSELASVIDTLGKEPDHIVTNQFEVTKIDERLRSKVSYMEAKDIHDWLIACADDDPFVTLHGYNRIVPEAAISKTMYNVHPGDTIKYPELRGKDPQKKALELGLDSTGVVIHQVDEGVDTGETQMVAVHDIKKGISEKDLIEELRQLAINLWSSFLIGKV